jgi:hypothetical protein
MLDDENGRYERQQPKQGVAPYFFQERIHRVILSWRASAGCRVDAGMSDRSARDYSLSYSLGSPAFSFPKIS